MAQLLCAQTPIESPTGLQLMKTVQRAIKGAEKNTYEIKPGPDQYVKIVVEQKGVDIRLRLLNASGKIKLNVDANATEQGVETIEFVVVDSEPYLLEVSKPDLRKEGNYQITFAEMRTATIKDKELDEARRLVFQANALWFDDKYDDALTLAVRAREIAERQLGSEDSLVGTALYLIANQYNYKGDYAKAEPYYLRALEIKDKTLGSDNIESSKILNQLGNLYGEKGDHQKAESAYMRSLGICQKLLEPNHRLIADVYNLLGSTSREKGDNVKANLYYQRSLEIREKALSPDDPKIADVLLNIANLTGDIKKAEPLYLRALAIREKAFGSESPEIGKVLYNIATVYVGNGDQAKAEDYGRRSLNNLEKALGAEHPIVSFPLNLLGVLYVKSGKYVEAEKVYLKAIEIKERTKGPFHPELAGSISNLANVYALNGEIEKAINAQKRAGEIVELNISTNLGTGSEREKVAYLQTLNPVYVRSLTLNFQYAPTSRPTTDLAAEIVLRQKGRVLDTLSDQIGVLRARFNAKDRSLLEALSEKNRQMSALILSGPAGISPIESSSRIRRLSDERETVEGEIGRRADAFFERSRPVEIAEVQAQIPKEASLLEFAVYRPVDFKDSENETARNNIGSRYCVFIIRNDGVVNSLDLGEKQAIDDIVQRLREALQDPKSQDIKQRARELEKRILSPIREFLADSNQLLIAPDGDLNLIPFEALVDESGKYLVEEYSISYLSSGRDLLRMRNSRPNRNTSLIVVNPYFGMAETTEHAKLPLDAKKDKKVKRRGVTVAENIANTYFTPLVGTEQEGRSIQALFPDSTLLTGPKANKDELKLANSPKMLHIASHGFYLEKSTISEVENDLLRSGIALAGANKHSDNNGIITALEASGLNLSGTKLVVLSACGTGLGEVQSGEGVFGLRRSFVLAGSESLVMSLWSVSDYVTRELMVNYYKNLKQGSGRSESLRKAQLQMLKDPKRSHPFYWGSFIVSGNWAAIED